MRRSLFAAAAALFCFFMGIGLCGAAPAASSDVWLQRLSGSWYDGTGREVLVIENGRINGQTVREVRSLAGGNPGSGIFCLADGTEIYLAWIGDDGHRLLRANEGGELLPSRAPEYFESVDGIFLGMREAEILDRWGEPEKRPAMQYWQYISKGVDLYFTGDVVTGIRLHATSSLHFLRSGLKGTSSLESYQKFYGWQQMPTLPIGPYMNMRGNSIGHGEYLFFDAYPISVLLSVFPNFS